MSDPFWLSSVLGPGCWRLFFKFFSRHFAGKTPRLIHIDKHGHPSTSHGRKKGCPENRRAQGMQVSRLEQQCRQVDGRVGAVFETALKTSPSTETESAVVAPKSGYRAPWCTCVPAHRLGAVGEQARGGRSLDTLGHRRAGTRRMEKGFGTDWYRHR